MLLQPDAGHRRLVSFCDSHSQALGLALRLTGLCFIACDTKICESNQTICGLRKIKGVEGRFQDFPPSVRSLEEIFLFLSSNQGHATHHIGKCCQYSFLVFRFDLIH